MTTETKWKVGDEAWLPRHAPRRSGIVIVDGAVEGADPVAEVAHA